MMDVDSLSPELKIEKLQEVISDLKALIASDGFKYYSLIIEQQRQVRHQQVFLVPLQTLDESLAQEYTKGEYQGLSIALHLPHQMIEDYANQLEQWRKQTEGDQDEQE